MRDMTMRNLPALASTAAAALLALSAAALAQELSEVRTPAEPLVLQSRGSFFVGGESVEQTDQQVAFGGHVTINQMYVEFMVPPEEESGQPPVIMVHGATLTGKTYDTTPDGRMGWYEYFVRQGHATYIVDQIARGRSGFDSAIYNDVRTGLAQPDAQPRIGRLTDEVNWTNFRFGPAVGEVWPDTQFPIDALDQLSTQAVPQITEPPVLASYDLNYQALSSLVEDLGGAVILGHSQSGAFPVRTALLDPSAVMGAIMVEPGSCGEYAAAELEALADVPILVIFGDHIGDVPTGIPGFDWQVSFDGCASFVAAVNDAGGNAAMLDLPGTGIPGNSHMPMQDRNNIEIADLILTWIDENIATPPR